MCFLYFKSFIRTNVIGMDKCPECGSRNLVRDPSRGEIYCADCGVVIEEELVDQRAEWRSYDSEEFTKRARTGPPMNPMMYDKGLSTRTPKSLVHSQRLRKTLDISGNERETSFALGEIERMASALKLPREIAEETALLYRKAARQDMLRGRSIEELLSAMLYIVCRQCHVPRTFHEIAEVSRVPLERIRKAYFYIKRKLGVNLMPPNPADYIPRFCSKLGYNRDIETKALEILKKIDYISKGWSPNSVAATAIYLAASTNPYTGVVRAKIARVAGTTSTTISNQVKKLKKDLCFTF